MTKYFSMSGMVFQAPGVITNIRLTVESLSGLSKIIDDTGRLKTAVPNRSALTKLQTLR